jgi:hypothetical protein
MPSESRDQKTGHNELSHVKTFEGSPRPADVFEPHQVSVELLSDMDEVFDSSRRMATRQRDDRVGESLGEVLAEGQRGVAIVTPGRLTILDQCPEPGSVPEEKLADIREMLPPDPPLQITAISYTHIEALTEDMSKAIPFRGFLIMWAYLGHSVLVFEGHSSAFESGVRNSDVLLVDSGMLPFLQPDWQAVAQRVMRNEGRILIHDRETYTLSLVTKAAPVQTPPYSGPGGEAAYVDLLSVLLFFGDRSSTEITSGETLPKLADFTSRPADFPWLADPPFKHEDLNADRVIEIILHKAGWRWYSPFKRTGEFPAPVLPKMMPNGHVRKWSLPVTLRKDPQGRRQVQIER